MNKVFLTALAISSALAGSAHAQGLIGGAQQGVAQGNAAAGPIGGLVGGAVGAATGTVGGVLGGDPLGYGARGYNNAGYGGGPGYGYGYGGPGYGYGYGGSGYNNGGFLGGGGVLGTGLLGSGSGPDLRTYIASEGIPSFSYGGRVRVGTVLPSRGVTYFVTPAMFGTPLNHTIINGQVVLTAPRTHRVVQILG